MNNIFPVHFEIVQRKEREKFLNQKAAIFWLTGLSGSGKTTIAKVVERKLFSQGYFVQIIDGDNVRDSLCEDLSFSLEDRRENIRRVAELTRLYVNSGIICINSFVSPTISIRELAKHIIGEQDFHEVFINTSLKECEKRDVKGLYKKARIGEIKNFTGIDSVYEKPQKPNLIINTEKEIHKSAMDLYNYIIDKCELT